MHQGQRPQQMRVGIKKESPLRQSAAAVDQLWGLKRAVVPEASDDKKKVRRVSAVSVPVATEEQIGPLWRTLSHFDGHSESTAITFPMKKFRG
jgi:hypothetical protein